MHIIPNLLSCLSFYDSPAGYRMMQPATNMAASWGMPSVGNSGLSALGQAAAGTTPQMMYATMQQFQTQ